MHGQNYIRTTVVKGLTVSDYHGRNPIQLPKAYTREDIPVNSNQIPRPEKLAKWPHLQQIADTLYEYKPELNIGILIGSNCPEALKPLQVISTGRDAPYATRLIHGWTITGPINENNNRLTTVMSCNRVMTQEVEVLKETILPTSLLKMLEVDFSERKLKTPDERGHSQEDLKFLVFAQENITMVDGHYQIPLPFRETDNQMPSNRIQSWNRANWQKKKMLRNENYRECYTEFMDKLLVKGYAEKVPQEELCGRTGKVWYLSHHGVFHPKKPNKIRVVFDASAKYQGTSLNDKLLQGPDLTNSLIGVLNRFRVDNIAFIADIESMFYQVGVPRNQQDYLRFLWWPDNNLNIEPEDYRMTVHLFGAVSSPSIANYVLKHIANLADKSHGSQVANTIRYNFYVDDCLKSIETEQQAMQLVNNITSVFANGGFRLTKFICNNVTVLRSIPVEERSKEVQSRNLDYEDLPVERALGIQWCVESDSFGFTILIREQPLTRRGILSVISSIYDPLGFVAPVILPMKRLLQELCVEENLGWDDEVPQEYKVRWGKWLTELPFLDKIHIPRCLKPIRFGNVVSYQVHIFSDACITGYGAVAYLRLCNSKDEVHCSFLMGKSRSALLKPVTIPRMELTAATVSVRLGQQLVQELNLKSEDVTYHTDSTTVIHYIKSETKRYQIFVANRVQLIRQFSEPRQWRYVRTAENPADEGSRGMTSKQLENNQRWLEGPAFLRELPTNWPKQPPVLCSKICEESVIDSNAITVNEATATIHSLIEHYSDWQRLKKAVAIYRRLSKILSTRHMRSHTDEAKAPFSVQELSDAESAILKFIQLQHFSEEMEHLTQEKNTALSGQRGRGISKISKASTIYRLSPFIANGLLRVGGRISKANLSDDMKHPILLPHKCHVTMLIIRNVHASLGHAGRNHVLAKIRERFWITHANATVRRVIGACVSCRRLRMPTEHQMMADLPVDRLTPAPAFTYCGVDYFGPYLVKQGRKESKRYGALFTCLTSRAVHIEVAQSLDTDSFIHALRRFIARRGPVREMRSDNGSNFVGAEKELFKSIKQDRIQQSMLSQNIDWKFNPPSASHMGGVWERQIRTVKNVLSQLLQEFSPRLDDESFHTLLCEVEAIVNSRPLTAIPSDTDDSEPITPNHILTMKSNVVLPPPGEFQRNDVYMRRRWRRVQYLANLFWSRWKREYLLTLQPRQKWNRPKRNLEGGDIVLVKDENTPRNKWTMGRVTSTEPDEQGFVRSVMIKTQNNELRRPVNKLVVLVPATEQQ